MAILNLEWQFISNSSPKSLPKATLISISIRRSILIPSWGRGLIIVCSTGSSSSLLEEASNALQLIQFSSSSGSRIKQPPVSNLQCSNVFVEQPESGDLTKDDLVVGCYKSTRLDPGFQLDQQTLKILIKHLLRSRDWSSISALTEDMISSDIVPDRATCGRLVASGIQSRKFKNTELLLGVFERKADVAVSAFGAVMYGYNKLHMYRSTVLVFERMVDGEVQPDPKCYCWIMEAHRKLGNSEKVLALFEEFESCELESSPVSLTAQIYFILCDSLGRSGRAFEALNRFRQMIAKGISPSLSFYASLVCSFAGIKEAEVAEDLFREAREKGTIKDPSVYLKLVLMYVEIGEVPKTINVMKTMRQMGIRVSDCVFCAVINGYVKKEGLNASMEAYEELMSLGCIPGQVTYASVINVYCRLGLISKAEKIFDEMMSRGFSKCVVAYSNMVSAYGKVNRVRDAMRLLAKMKEKGCKPNVWVYNSLINMHGRTNDLRQVKKLWKEMKRRKVEPDKVTYTSIIGAYSKAREFEECIEFYQEFRTNGGKIDRAMAGIMVGVFSKTSRIDELLKLLECVKTNRIQVDERLYMSSLNALRDSGIQVQVRWFRDTFGYVKIERKSPEGDQILKQKE